MRAILFWSLLLLSWNGFGQVRGGGGIGAGRPGMARLQGRVLDAATRTPAEFAAVTVLAAQKDSVLGGALVQTNGDFAVDGLPFGPCRVRIAFMGYRTLEQQVMLTPGSPEKDLGNLMLETDEVMLKEAEVVRERATTMMQVDRRVFNVEKDLSTQGGSAVDVMKNVPGLSVDVEGNVQLRGGNPLVLIDGRPTTLSLEDLPATEIERVEVITNPSAAFDAGTSGGIVNVVLKKNTKPGYYGNVQGGAGTNDRYQGGLNLNIRDGRWGFNLSYNYNTSGNRTDARTDRSDLRDGSVLGTFAQRTTSDSRRTMHGGRLGAEFRIDNRNTLNLSQSFRGRHMQGSDRQTFTSTAFGEAGSYGDQYNADDSRHESLTSQVGFRHTAPKEGKEWTADATYNRASRNSGSTFDTWTYANGTQQPFSPRMQRNSGGSDLQQITAQFDFIDPLNARNKLEWGLKGDHTDDHTWIDVAVSSPVIGTDVTDTALTNDYAITNMINAAYVNWSHKLNDRWSMQTGLRFEQSWYDVELIGKDRDFGYRYPDGGKDLAKALFPALYLVRKWEDKRELQVNFSRKISRPRFWQVMPVVMSSDSRNVRIGNPELAPELSNLAEINHLLPMLGGKLTWFTSVFGKYTEDVITSYSSPLSTDSIQLLNTFVNGDNSFGGGWENVLKFEPGKGPQITLSGTVQYVDIGLTGADGGSRNQGINWEAKALVSYRLSKKLVAQVNGEYEAPRIQPQGRSLSQYGVDASVNYDITKSLSAVAAVNDVFYTRRWGSLLDTPDIYQESYRRRDQRNVRVTLTWRFGQQETSLFRRRNQQRREPGESGGDEGF
ncbi:MAG TPA: TonB-dependent receptor [Flavobacteriales bacterium]